MLGISEVTYTYTTITCDWPGCTNRISLQAGPEDIDRELKDLRALRGLAERRCWSIENDGRSVTCPDHNRKERQ